MWLNRSMRLVTSVVEVVKPIRGLRKKGIASLLRAKGFGT
jgi:hypothetical protein